MYIDVWMERERERKRITLNFRCPLIILKKNVFCYSVYSWGWGVHGQLGHGNIEDALTPTKVTSLTSLNVSHIQAGHCHSLVLTEQVREH